LTPLPIAQVYAPAAISGRRALSGAITMNTGHVTLGETLWTVSRAYYFGGYYFARFYR
jgi:hypothetical protein